MNKEHQMNLNLMVADLITDHGSWDVRKLNELFPPEDVNRILSFPPNKSCKDEWIWAHSKEGKYIVKSGSWLLSQPIVFVEPPPLETRRLNELKSKVSKMFMWRVLYGAVVVAECLSAHSMQADLVCQSCKKEPETIVHVFFECELAKKVWSGPWFPVRQHVSTRTVYNYMDYMIKLLDKDLVSVRYRQAIPWLICGIWKQRNEKVYTGNPSDADILIAQALEEAEEWRKLNELEDATQGRRSTDVESCKKWCRPRAGILKCNVSSSWVNSSQLSGGSWIVRDHRGKVRYHARDAFLPVHNRIAAELRCILWACQSLCDLQVVVRLWCGG